MNIENVPNFSQEKFSQLLQIDCNMIIFGDSELENFVKTYRSEDNTQFVLRDLSWFKNNEFYNKIEIYIFLFVRLKPIQNFFPFSKKATRRIYIYIQKVLPKIKQNL